MKETVEEAGKINAKNYDNVDYNIAFNGHEVEKAFYDGFISGAEWKSKQSPWISVQNESIPHDVDVILFCKRNGTIMRQFFEIGYTIDWFIESYGISHWMIANLP